MIQACIQCGDQRDSAMEDPAYECPRCFAVNHDLPYEDEKPDGLTLSGPLAPEILEAWND
jgi:hypothetical protein